MGDLRKLGVNLVPFPRLHFFLISQAPLQSQDNSEYALINVQELMNQCYSPRNFYSNVKPDDGKYMTASLIFRGPMSTQEVDENAEKRQASNSDDFVEWIPNNMKTSVVEVPPKDAKQSCTFVANTTALKGIFQRLATQFGAMYKRKAFLHWYKGEGMDEMEFQEADKNVRDLILSTRTNKMPFLGMKMRSKHGRQILLLPYCWTFASFFKFFDGICCSAFSCFMHMHIVIAASFERTNYSGLFN